MDSLISINRKRAVFKKAPPQILAQGFLKDLPTSNYGPTSER
ncbi:MAG: hypothetical protein NVS9B15_13090 [Acidobacteriaceae bacterium]